MVIQNFKLKTQNRSGMKAKQNSNHPFSPIPNHHHQITNIFTTTDQQNPQYHNNMECKDDIPPHMNAAVDTSRPFGSVKEAVALFGQCIPLRESHNSFKPRDGSWSLGTPNPGKSPTGDGEQGGVEHALKKLEAELSEAKEELKLLKKKETETEVAVAALNAELHWSMSRLAKAEADAAARRLTGLEKGKEEPATNEGRTEISSYSSTLAQILRVPENDDRTAKGNKKRIMAMTPNKKQKPIVPLVWELFSWRKTNADDIHKSIYYSSPHFFN